MGYTLTINPAFRDCLIPLSTEQFAALEAAIVSDKAIRDPIIVWKNTIVDGHNRYQIAKKHGLEYSVLVKHFDGEQEALTWIVENQAARRNLTPEQLSYARGKAYKIAKNEHGGKRTSENAEKHSEISSGQNVHLKKTAENKAETHGVTEKTIRRDGKYADALDALPAPLKAGILSGDIPAAKKDVEALAAVNPEHVATVARKLRTGQAKNLKAAMEGLPLKPKAAKPKQGKPKDTTAEAFRKAEAGLGLLSKTIDDLGSRFGKFTAYKTIDRLLRDVDKELAKWKKEAKAV